MLCRRRASSARLDRNAMGEPSLRLEIVKGLALLLLAGVVTACAPARIDLDPRVRERLVDLLKQFRGEATP